MKTSLFAAAAAMTIAFAATSSFAEDFYTPNGFIGADYTYDHINLGSGTGDANSYGVSGSTSAHLVANWNLEVDADYAHVDLSNGGGSYDQGGADGHLFWRNEGGAIGVVGGGHSYDGVTTYDFGAEGAKFIDKWTVKADVRYQWADSEFHVNETEANVGADYFLADNLRLDGSAAFDRLGFFGKEFNGWNVHAGGEYQFAKLPVSLYAAVTYGEQSSVSTKDTAVHAGVRWNFGGGSLKARERSGATFAPTGEGDFFRVANLLY
jgi:hypothetical protein